MWFVIVVTMELLGIAALMWLLSTALVRCFADLRTDASHAITASAERCALGLLRDLLDEREFEQLRARGFLDVPSPSCAERIYRIPRRAGLVTVYERGRAVRDLCVRPTEPLPSSDVVLMHKMMILASEEDYLVRANQFPALLLGQRYRP